MTENPVPSPAARVVLALARGADGPPEPIPEFSSDEVVELAGRHQVGPLCHWFGATVPSLAPLWSRLTPQAQTQLRLARLHHRFRNEALLRDLADVQTALTAHGVPALVLKGPSLMLRAYPDIDCRPIDDLDLCVPEAEFRGAFAALTELGYRCTTPMPASPRAALERAHYVEQLRFLARGRRMVELHFRLVNVGPPRDDEAWIWDTAQDVELGDLTFRAPGPEAMLLHLLLHANQHGFGLLRLLYDIRFALARDAAELDRDVLLGAIRRLRCHTSAWFGLQLASELAGALVDPTLLDPLRPGRLRRRRFARHWRLDAARRLEPLARDQRLEAPRLYLLEMGSLAQRLGYLARVGWRRVRPGSRRSATTE